MGIFAIVFILIGLAGFDDPKAGVVPGSRTRMTTRRPIFRWPTARSRRWVGAFLDRAAGDQNLLAVIAIGSAVRPGVESEDLDLLAICRDRSAVAERPPIEVDLRKIALDRIEPSLRSANDLLIGAVQFGRPLLDSEGHWAAITRRWRHRLPLPDPEVADERAAAARKVLLRMRRSGTRRRPPNTASSGSRTEPAPPSPAPESSPAPARSCRPNSASTAKQPWPHPSMSLWRRARSHSS